MQQTLELNYKAQEAGIELFVLDDGWFGHRDADNSSLGDWFVDRRKLPHGLSELAKEIHKRGMKFGLWCEKDAKIPWIEEEKRLRKNHIEEIHKIIPQDGSSEYDQYNGRQFSVMSQQGIHITDQFIHMKHIRILHRIKFFLRKRFQVVYIEETVEPDNWNKEYKPVHSGA